MFAAPADAPRLCDEDATCPQAMECDLTRNECFMRVRFSYTIH